MYVATIVFPGSWLDGDPDEAHKVTSLLHLIESELADAAIALHMFDSVRHSHPTIEEHQASSDRKRQIEEKLAAERGITWHDRSEMEKIRAESNVIYINELSQSGIIPRGYINRFSFIHAKSFLYAIDGIRKAITTMKKYPISQVAADKALSSLISSMPDLAGVRDSTAHSDERTVGKARNKIIVPQPITTNEIHAPGGGVLFLGSLFNNVFSCTLDNGFLGSVEVSINSLKSTQHTIQDLLNDIPWRDPKFMTVYPIT